MGGLIVAGVDQSAKPRSTIQRLYLAIIELEKQPFRKKIKHHFRPNRLAWIIHETLLRLAASPHWRR